jgi:hypothetical protein
LASSLWYTFRRHSLAWVACLFFISAGHLFVPLLGIEHDEALFANAIFTPRAELYSIRVGSLDIPIMLMSYLGALKTWIYLPIFKLWGTGLASLREPMLVTGAASLVLFYLLLRRIAGDRAAWIGCSLLAADSTYLLSICFDWGPVALQHLLLIGGAFLLVRFYQTGSHRSLAGGFFLWGLAIWDKALALWVLSGLGVAACVIFPRQILAVTTRRRLAIATTALLLGALPLVIFNIDQNGATFRGNFERETNSLGSKARFLYLAASGPGLLGWINYEDWQTKAPHAPEGTLQKASARLSEFAGKPRRHLLPYGFIAALLVTPWAGWTAIRIVLFSLIALAVAWIQMAITANAGASVHHTVLLWPLPHLIIAIAFGGASRRIGRAGLPAVAAVTVVMVAAGILVLNEHYTIAIRNGGAQAWTDAIFRLSDYLKKQPPKSIICMDWGILDPLRLLHRGKLPLTIGSDPFVKPEIVPSDRNYALGMISSPDNVFIAHTREYEFFTGVNDRLLKFAGEAGFQPQTIEVIPDNYGRRVYEVYRFVK